MQRLSAVCKLSLPQQAYFRDLGSADSGPRHLQPDQGSQNSAHPCWKLCCTLACIRGARGICQDPGTSPEG